MDTKALRQKILDLAIHGKLVPQDPNDEPASVLLERIKAEKERLIKEGKIKRSKKSAKSSDTPHYENVPFELPTSGVWRPIATPLFDKLGIPEAYREQAAKAVLATIPAGRFGTAEEVANAVIYLASDEAAWTVGAEIVIDGGRLLNA